MLWERSRRAEIGRKQPQREGVNLSLSRFERTLPCSWLASYLFPFLFPTPCQRPALSQNPF